MRDLTLRELQTQLPWVGAYHQDFRANPQPHKDFGHALLHILKAAGKIAALVDDAEHVGCEFKGEETDRFVADLVICALRMANTCPGRTIDLQHAVEMRLEGKNSLKLHRREVLGRILCRSCAKGHPGGVKIEISEEEQFKLRCDLCGVFASHQTDLLSVPPGDSYVFSWSSMSKEIQRLQGVVDTFIKNSTVCSHFYDADDKLCSLPPGHKGPHGTVDSVGESHDRWRKRADSLEDAVRSLIKIMQHMPGYDSAHPSVEYKSTVETAQTLLEATP